MGIKAFVNKVKNSLKQPTYAIAIAHDGFYYLTNGLPDVSLQGWSESTSPDPLRQALEAYQFVHEKFKSDFLRPRAILALHPPVFAKRDQFKQKIDQFKNGPTEIYLIELGFGMSTAIYDPEEHKKRNVVCLSGDSAFLYGTFAGSNCFQMEEKLASHRVPAKQLESWLNQMAEKWQNLPYPESLKPEKQKNPERQKLMTQIQKAWQLSETPKDLSLIFNSYKYSKELGSLEEKVHLFDEKKAVQDLLPNLLKMITT